MFASLKKLEIHMVCSEHENSHICFVFLESGVHDCKLYQRLNSPSTILGGEVL